MERLVRVPIGHVWIRTQVFQSCTHLPLRPHQQLPTSPAVHRPSPPHTRPSVSDVSSDPIAPDTSSATGSIDRSIVIVGGGFGGLYTALALAQHRDHPPILLIEPNERFVFQPLLYELLSEEMRSWEIAPRYDSLLASRGIAWLQDRVDQVDTEQHTLKTRSGHELRYGRLVIASGGQPATFNVPGALEHALFFRTLHDVERLQGLVRQLRQQALPLQRLAIVGAGPSGVELACKLADLLGGSTLIELIEQGEDLLPQARSFNREQARLALQRRDVRLRCRNRVRAIHPGGLDLLLPEPGNEAGRQERLPAEAVIWTAGFQARPPALNPPVPGDRLGRLPGQPDLRLQGHHDVFVIGDGAHVADEDGEPFPANAQVAFQQAPCLAANLLHSLAGEPLDSFHWNDLGEMISLGLGEASLTGGGFTLAGAAAFQLRRLAYLTRLPGLPLQLKVAAGWLTDGR
ncbi:FAD-dependent oxidoreductase [Synechococcus sp. CBW1006]|nr:FAD-dependent oxidoreductase [Synechococcus sp. CBW1006]